MATAWTPLANLTLSGSASTVTFSSISGSYRDLVLVISATNTVGNVGLRARLNSDTGTNYGFVLMDGNGSSAASTNNTNQTELQIGANRLAVGSTIVHLLDYSATDKHKTTLTRTDFTDASTTTFAHRWASTAAVTTILLYPSSNQFATGSTFALYGVSA